MSLKQNLTDYINKEIEYGKPSSADYFIRTDLAREIKNNPALLANNELEKYINDYWKKTVSENPDAVFCGGYDFYRYLSEQQINNDNYEEIIESYQIPEQYKCPLSADKLKSQDTVYEVMQEDEETKHYITVKNAHIRVYENNYIQLVDTINSDVASRIKKLKCEQKYLGTEVNVFINIPKSTIAHFALYSIEQDLINGYTDNTGNTSGNTPESIESEVSEKSEKAYDSQMSTQSVESEKAIEADRLSEEGVQQVTDEFIRKILNERKDVIENIENRIEKHRQEQELHEKWYYRASEHPTEFTTKDIYADSVLNDAREILKERHNLFIYGNTGDGKTELAYLLAHELTGQNIGKNSDTECKRICWTSARNADSLVGAGLKQYGLLDRFLKYISDNNISEPCVLICNEVQASDMGYILGEKLWESFNDTRPALIPDNLYFIFTGCMDRDFGIDTQVLERIKPVEIDYLSKKNKDVHNKILEAYGSDYEDILNTIEEINDSENRQIISMRQFVRLVNNESITIVHRELLSETNQDKIKKLERNNDKY